MLRLMTLNHLLVPGFPPRGPLSLDMIYSVLKVALLASVLLRTHPSVSTRQQDRRFEASGLSPLQGSYNMFPAILPCRVGSHEAVQPGHADDVGSMPSGLVSCRGRGGDTLGSAQC